MIEGILAKKLGMTQIFSADRVVPVTVVKADLCHVTQRKTREKDGYDAVQLGFEEKKEARTPKPMQGHFKKAGTPNLYHVAEFGGEELDAYKPGQAVKCSEVFKVGDVVDIRARSKGRGFAGVIKRWNFSRGPMSHGSGHNRAPGSIGQSAYPSKVFKGIKLPGQMGNKEITIQNLEVVDINEEENIMLVKGCVPGPMGAVLTITRSIKKKGRG
ncbi:MAG: 50S ribosomal protein L3 [Thermodesulfobacteriota bacterium]